MNSQIKIYLILNILTCSFRMICEEKNLTQHSIKINKYIKLKKKKNFIEKLLYIMLINNDRSRFNEQTIKERERNIHNSHGLCINTQHKYQDMIKR